MGITRSHQAREHILRRELAAAIKLRNAADEKLTELKTKVARGARLLEAEQAALEKLEASAKQFEALCISDSAFKILAAMETNTDIPTGSGAGRIANNNEAIIAAKMRLEAFRAADASLADNLAAAQDEAARASSAVDQLANAIIAIIRESVANAVIEAQEKAWRLQDIFTAACTIAGVEATRELQERTVKRLRRFTGAIAAGHPYMDRKDWQDYQDAQAKVHEPSWRGFAEALTRDASAQLKEATHE